MQLRDSNENKQEKPSVPKAMPKKNPLLSDA